MLVDSLECTLYEYQILFKHYLWFSLLEYIPVQYLLRSGLSGGIRERQSLVLKTSFEELTIGPKIIIFSD